MKILEKMVDKDRYQKLIEKLIYLTLDLVLYLMLVYQVNTCTPQRKLVEVYKILRHLKGSLKRGLFLRNMKPKI